MIVKRKKRRLQRRIRKMMEEGWKKRERLSFIIRSEMDPGTRLVGNSVYFDPKYMNTLAQVYTYGAAAWFVFIAIMQAILLFATDPREPKEDRGKTESARMLLRHHETNKNSTSSREREVENTQTVTEERSRKTERTQEH